ncbi:adenosine deaminase [Tunturiibacter empetritectus]|uniref:adenosine deaminase n=1 Tax=Tunturiibacter lichenicola TaxID=2051959 RepID=A0A852V8C0_9BACT|nr:adenosine deaminase [Edaphobacter lichenicola]NYF87950.1 adenosine deaminase [Edaphobacter lichenicola]
MLRRLQSLTSVVLSLCFVAAAHAQVATPPATAAAVGKGAGTTPTPREQRAIKAFNTARQSPLQLNAFLTRMPKGADLHMHLSGAIYAETLIKDAASDLLCVDLTTHTLVKPSGTTRSIPPQPVCGEGHARAEGAFKDQKLYDALVDSFSMRAFVPSSGVSGHDQFFATFDRFRTLNKSHAGEWLDEVATRAAAQNEQYLEVMETPIFTDLSKIVSTIDWPSTPADPAQNRTGNATGTSREDLSHLRETLLNAGLRDEVAVDRKELDNALDARDRIEDCGQPSAQPACSVKVRFLYQVLRAFPPQHVFAQTLLAFEVASVDPRVVGLNFVQPEDAYLSMSEYHRQMLMLDYLHSVYPKVHIALHAGEIAPGLVPPDGLRFHIREAVDLGHAERIGHGVDVMYENEPQALLKELADRHIMVEINLTSNDVILGVTAPWHPLPSYRAARVPIALSTDDEGVSRIDLTNEYTRAAMDFDLSYLDLKQSARTSLEHNFLPGPSLWQQPDVFTKTVAACAGQPLGSANPTPNCLSFLQSSEKAAEQWELEHRYDLFESNLN